MTKFCRFCHGESIEPLYAANRENETKTANEFTCTNCGFGIHGPIVKCFECGIIYVDETITQQQISTYYEVAKDPVYFTEQPAREKTFGRYLRNLEEMFPKKGKLLDIGTNTGLFVKLSQNSMWIAYGLEPNKWAVDYAEKNYGVSIINKSFEEKVFKNEKFDVITMWDVIEHFTDPISEVRKVFNLLKPGGVFAFSTIDPESQLAKIMGTKWSWYMEMHRVFFSRHVAANYLKKTGFKKIIFTRHFRYLSLGYLATRVAAISPKLSKILSLVISHLSLAKLVIPYYANDLYDCYAFK